MTIRATQAATITIEAAEGAAGPAGSRPGAACHRTCSSHAGADLRRVASRSWKQQFGQAPAALTNPTGGAFTSSGVTGGSTSPLRRRSGSCASQVQTHVVARRNARGGRTAAEHMISALRCLYRYAIDDGLPRPRRKPCHQGCQASPAAEHPPRADRSDWRRSTGRRDHRQRPVPRLACCCGCTPRPPADAAAHWRCACSTSTRTQCLIRLTEKGDTVRWQPVTPTLAAPAAEHAERGTPRRRPAAALPQRPADHHRRYDHLWNRIGEHLPWVATQGISTHWLRHTTLTWVERHFGYGIARAYAGHTGRGDAGATSTYVRADL